MNKLIAKQLELYRTVLNRWMVHREREYLFPEMVKYLADVSPEGAEEEYRKMDIFYPEESNGEKRPVIVDLHGGGMVLCNRKVNRPFCVELA